MRRITKWLLAGLALIAIGYLAAANLLLMTSLGARFASSPTTKVEWRSGYSVWPTRVHLRELHVTIRGKEAVWGIRAETASARLSFLALLGGTLHASSADLADVSVVADNAPVAAPLARTSLARYPVLGSFQQALPPTARPAAESGGEDLLRVEALTVDRITEVRSGGVSYGGAANLRGALRMQRGTLWIERATLDVAGGELDTGAGASLLDLHAHARLDAHRVDLDVSPARAWLGSANAQLDLRASPTMAGSLAPSEVTLPGMKGVLEAHLRIVDGVLASGSAMSLDASGTGTTGDQPSAAASLAVAADGSATLDATAKGVPFAAGALAAGLLSAESAHLVAHSPGVRIAAPLANIEASVDLTGIRIAASKLPVLGSLVREGSGEATGSAHLDMQGGALSGKLEAHADALDLDLGQRVVGGAAVDVTADIVTWNRETLSGTLQGRASFVSSRDGTSGSLALSKAVVHGGDPRGLEGTVALHMSSAQYALQAIMGNAELPALLGAVAATQPIDATATLHVRGAALSLDDIDATAGFLVIHGTFTKRAEVKAATLLVEGGPFAAGVDVRGPTTTLILADARGWFKRASSARRDSSDNTH
ncbi:hypothetical protein BH11MYX4_BH11MYX4_08750 [soil metagenome]